MNICYAYIGVLPSYTIEQAHQLRLFYSGPVYFILNDYDNPIVKTLQDKYTITIVRYDDVIDTNFHNMIYSTQHKFWIINNLKGREYLFIYSFERFYVLYNLMKKNSLENILFVELDNLIYDNPVKWVKSFENIDMAYLFDNINRASAGISYIKNIKILRKLLDYFTYFIENDTGFISEMTPLYRFMENEKLTNNRVSFLPIHWADSNKPAQSYELWNSFNNSIFDASSIGIYLGGLDPYHTDGKIIPGAKNPHALIDYTSYKIEYIRDEKGMKIPYILNGESWVKINNLHIHSKDLTSHLSVPLDTI